VTSVFDLSGPLLDGVFAIEASAGTGKTYSLTGLVARHVAERGLRPDQLLMVTFTRAATSDMRDRTRDACRSLLEVLEADPDLRTTLGADEWMLEALPSDEAEAQRRAANVRSFLATYDEATITTIHGFCQLVLNRSGLLSPAIGDVTLVGDARETVVQVISDLLIGTLSEHPNLFGDSPTKTPRTITSAISELDDIVGTVMSNPSTLRIPQLSSIDSHVDVLRLEPHERWAAIVERVISIVHERRQASGVFGYDDLIHSVTALLLGENHDRIVCSLREQYRLVLIDEFQDTDVGQWTIFERAFVRSDPRGASDQRESVAVGVVGDPKQAIYRFRGADIDAYRSAIESIDQRVELVTNYRSNARLISAVNHVFDGVTFGDSSITYRQVTARPGPADEGVIGHVPFELRFVPYCEEAGSSRPTSGLKKAEQIELENGTLDKWGTNTDLALDFVYADMVASISELIASGEIIDKKGRQRKIRPGDIAVLVRSHSHAERIRDAFSQVGIPAVRYRANSVFKSPAAMEWKIFLSALAAPSRVDRSRAAALSVFGRSDLGTLLSPDTGSVEIETWQSMIAQWASDVRELGLANVYFRLRSDRQFMNRVMSEVEGERLLTDLDHIAEVLASVAALARGAGASDCLQVLERLAEEAGDDDEFQRRIETDAESVHIATIHHSKGLEFPIVFLPTLTKMFSGNENPFVFSSDGRRVIDLATPVEWTWEDEHHRLRDDRKAAASGDIAGDLMRMLYVAVTRAEQKVVMYWTPSRSAADSSIGRLLFAPREDGRRTIDPESGVPVKGVVPKSNAAMRAMLEELSTQCSDISVSEVPRDDVSMQVVSVADEGIVDVAVASFARTEPLRRPGWGKWSYSGIANTLGTVHSAMAEPFVPGADEGHRRPVKRIAPGNAQEVVLFPDELSGAVFGSRIHEIFEAVEPAAPDLSAQIHREVGERFARHVSADLQMRLCDAIEAVCRTPLGPSFHGRTLADLPVRDRLAEMVFDMRIPDSPLAVSRIGELLRDHLDPSDPFIAYGESLVDRAGRIRMAGYLYGEIDAVFRLHRADGAWSAIISDYKTNLLHDPGSADPLAAYDRSNLARVMADDHYVLQAVLYQVALHRYLRWRVAEYRPDVHLGGIAYLFVRGLIGPDAPVNAVGDPVGVFTWKPPMSLIEALDQELTR
jgi:exodeoxyribonuclease V beta subunit